MKSSSANRVYLALLHHPVKNKNGEVITSAVTNLDLHDLSRLAKTYGVSGLYVITPLADQQRLARRIIDHWQEGFGADYNPKRREALCLVRIVSDLDAAIKEIKCLEPGRSVLTIATGASERPGAISFLAMKKQIKERDSAYVVMLGTAWGLTDTFIAEADFILAPIQGNTGYNHLSVRAAAAIILDRVLGNR